MKIIAVTQPGAPEVLALADAPMPVVGSAEVLIKVAASGINRADVLQRRGKYPSPPGAPANPGLEVAGTVVAMGSGVRDFNVGDKVCALLQGGGYSEYCAVSDGQVLPIPGNLDFIQAAGLPEAYFTVWSNVFEFGRLQPGERFLVHGGSSGIGVSAIQLAAALGHVVYTTAGSEDKCRFCESIGAARAINYKTQDFATEIEALTAGKGVDVILDMVGGSYMARNIQVLGTQGRLVILATQGGNKGEIDIMRVMQKRLTITGSTLRTRDSEFKRAIKAKLLEHVWPLIASGAIKPVIDQVFPFEQAAAAHERMETSEHKGKLVLKLG